MIRWAMAHPAKLALESLLLSIVIFIRWVIVSRGKESRINKRKQKTQLQWVFTHNNGTWTCFCKNQPCGSDIQ